jgi:hypothetical protein
VCFLHAFTFAMSDLPPIPVTPPEVSLLLRTHAEQRWLSHEVSPVARQLQTREGLPEEQVGAALAYLEVVWSEAARRAGDTDGAATQLELCLPEVADAPLGARAQAYHATVVAQRAGLYGQVASLLTAAADVPSKGLSRYGRP